MLHHHLLLLRAVIKGLPLLLWELLLVLHILLWGVAHEISLIIYLVWSTCIIIEVLLLLWLHVLEVHKLLPHHVLHILEVHLLVGLHLRISLYLRICLLIKPGCLEVKVPIISLKLHSCHVHWLLEVLWECLHVLHLHVLEVLHVLVDIDWLLLLHEVLWVKLLLELVGSLLDHGRGWWRYRYSRAGSGCLLCNSILLHSDSYYVHCNSLILLRLLRWCRYLDTLWNRICYCTWLNCKRGRGYNFLLLNICGLLL